METQELLNKIAILTGSIDPLVRAEEKEAIKIVVSKMLSLINDL